MASKKTKLTCDDFCRWFRKKVRDPLVKSALNEAQKNFINSGLAQDLFLRIVRLEVQEPHMTGANKMNRLMSEIQTVMITAGLKDLMPLVRQWAEQSVLYIYKEYFMEKFKLMGMHDWLESFLGDDVDEDGDVGGTPVKSTAVIPQPLTDSQQDNCLPDSVKKSALFSN